MTDQRERDVALFQQINTHWRAPEQTEVQRIRFDRQLQQALSSRAHTPGYYGWKLAIATFTLVLGALATSYWGSSSHLEGPASIASDAPSLIAIWDEEESSLDEEALPDDYLLLSQVID